MTHDIMHCNNEDCPAKERCRRYQVYIEDVENNYFYCTYITLTDEEKERVKKLGSCPNFWEFIK